MLRGVTNASFTHSVPACERPPGTTAAIAVNIGAMIGAMIVNIGGSISTTHFRPSAPITPRTVICVWFWVFRAYLFLVVVKAL